jgi:hypothetical protein
MDLMKLVEKPLRLVSQFGTCRYCIEKSLQTSILCCLLLLVALLAAAPVAVTVALGAFAGTTTALWCAHLFAFAARASLTSKEEGKTRRHALLIFVKSLAFIGVGSVMPSALAQTLGLPDGYRLASCCYKGCGGACCRCGSAAGYLSDCSTTCVVGVKELRAMTALALARPLLLSGRMVHVQRGKPLENEQIAVLLPGGQEFSGKSSGDGTFSIQVGSGASPSLVAVGDLKSVPTSEREAGESSTYFLFLTKA